LLFAYCRIFLAVHLACTPPYDTWWDGLCFFTYQGTISWTQGDTKCSADNAMLTSIHSAQENANLNSFAYGGPYDQGRGYWLGLRCNGTSSNFYWEDGTTVDYTNFGVATVACNASTADYHFYMSPSDAKWYNDKDWSWYQRAYVCKKNVRPEDSICEEYDNVPSTKTCVSIYSASKTTTDGEKQCVATGGHLASIHNNTVNDYVRRSAISRNLLDGVLIGLKQSGTNASGLAWNDSTMVDYTNFNKDFPNSALGQCFAMQTGSIAGDWVNVVCDKTTIPFVCTKPAYDFPDVYETSLCPTQNYSDGDMIYSPMFPKVNNKNSCEYLVVGPAGATNVQVEVIFFESNRCCDSLTIYEGVAGDKKIATLAGSTFNGNVYKSTIGPAMRLVYSVQSGAHVRGWQLKVYA
ncbi:hypothetical protein PENTCL1PPCAC_19117, partial [Pristionchus entomophagus]